MLRKKLKTPITARNAAKVCVATAAMDEENVNACGTTTSVY
jgi:hypothetical protein